MITFLAICQNPDCRRGFIIDKEIDLEEGTTFQLDNRSVSPCPYCGSNGWLFSGNYKIINKIARLIEGSDNHLSSFKTLYSFFAATEHPGFTKEEAIKRVENISPQLGEWFKNQIREKPTEWLQVFLSLLTLIVVIHSTYNNNDETKELFIKHLLKDQERIKNKENEENEENSPKKNSSRIPRNKKCPCMSGRKFKNCHGKDKPKLSST